MSSHLIKQTLNSKPAMHTWDLLFYLFARLLIKISRFDL